MVGSATIREKAQAKAEAQEFFAGFQRAHKIMRLRRNVLRDAVVFGLRVMYGYED